MLPIGLPRRELSFTWGYNEMLSLSSVVPSSKNAPKLKPTTLVKDTAAHISPIPVLLPLSGLDVPKRNIAMVLAVR